MTKGVKAQKKVVTGNKPTIEVVLPLITAYARKPIIAIGGNMFAKLDIDSISEEDLRIMLNNFKAQVKEQLANKRESLPLAEDVLMVLRMQEIERDDKEKPKLKEGLTTPTVFDIKERRRMNRIKVTIEEAWDSLEEELLADDDFEGDLDEEPVEGMSIGITLKCDDAKFLAERMIRYYEKDCTGTSFHIVEAHDIFTDLKNEATKLYDAYRTGKEEKKEKKSK